MRTLRFLVDNQTITPDPECDFEGLFPGAEEQLQAEFVFSPEWKNTIKVAAFWSIMDSELPPQVLEGDRCIIPVEASIKPVFKIQVLGKRSRVTLSTNKLKVYQKGGNQ